MSHIYIQWFGKSSPSRTPPTGVLCLFVFVRPGTSLPGWRHRPLHLVSEDPQRRLRSFIDRSYAVPRTCNTFCNRSVAIAEPRVWNSLPEHLRDEDITYRTFRRELKKALVLTLW